MGRLLLMVVCIGYHVHCLSSRSSWSPFSSPERGVEISRSVVAQSPPCDHRAALPSALRLREEGDRDQTLTCSRGGPPARLVMRMAGGGFMKKDTMADRFYKKRKAEAARGKGDDAKQASRHRERHPEDRASRIVPLCESALPK